MVPPPGSRVNPAAGSAQVEQSDFRHADREIQHLSRRRRRSSCSSYVTPSPKPTSSGTGIAARSSIRPSASGFPPGAATSLDATAHRWLPRSPGCVRWCRLRGSEQRPFAEKSSVCRAPNPVEHPTTLGKWRFVAARKRSSRSGSHRCPTSSSSPSPLHSTRTVGTITPDSCRARSTPPVRVHIGAERVQAFGISVTPLGHDGGMDVVSVVERVREVSSVSGDAPAAGRSVIESAITASAQIKSWLAAADARLAQALAAQVSFPEKTIADCTRESLRDAAKAKERADTLGKVPGFADALGAAALTPGACRCDHVEGQAAHRLTAHRVLRAGRRAGRCRIGSHGRRVPAAAGDRSHGRPNATTAWTVSSGSAARPHCGCGPTTRACGASTAASTRCRVPSSTPASKPPCKHCSPKPCPRRVRPILC